MRPHCSFTGTVSDEPKIISGGTRKPFLAFTVESPDSYNQWPNRVKCCVYDKDLEAVAKKVVQGAVIAVEGDVSAEAYINRNDATKAIGTLRMFVKAFEVFVPGEAPAANSRPATTAPAAKSAPAAAKSKPDDDDVPF